MLSAEFTDELFKPQELYSETAMKSVFEKLVHSSIMKLNTSSMDKLYDLMTMVFKYQTCMCPTPYDLLFVTLNHLDTIRRYVTSSPVTTYLVDRTHSRLIQQYGSLTTGEMQLVRCTILNFFQDLKIRVSVFLKEGLQNQNGSFVIPTTGVPVPHGTEIPGTITEFGSDGKVVSTTMFDSGADYRLPNPVGSLEALGNRGTKLGCNIYSTNQDAAEPCVSEDKTSDSQSSTLQTESVPQEVPPLDSRAQEELTLLAHLIGLSTSSKPQFTLNLFSPEQEIHGQQEREKQSSNENRTTIVTIDGSKKFQHEELNKIMSDVNFDKLDIHGALNDDRQELLDLMDSTM